MDEAFLHYIWKFQFFDKSDLQTTKGQPLNIIRPGFHNHDAGADFSDSRILIDKIEWNGSIEIHVKAKDWYAHQHHDDPAYNGVVLHVVWSSDNGNTKRSDQTDIPVLELKNRIDLSQFEKYRKLTNGRERILCKCFISSVERVKIFEAFDKAVVARLQRKANEILIRYRKNKKDWEETCFQILAGNFGFKVNKESFLSLAEAVPFKIMQKHSDNLIQIEAILFGIAGFLDRDIDDTYYNVLKKEYHFLKSKYGFSSYLGRQNFKFLRLRPANFPTIRIAQLAKLISIHQNIFSMLIHTRDTKKLIENFSITQSDYWLDHYDFDKKAKSRIGSLGRSGISNILINTVAPMLAAYSIEKDEPFYLDHAQVVLQNLNAEKNNITEEWSDAGVHIDTAFDSQACIELLNEYCQKKRCLECSMGIDILQPN